MSNPQVLNAILYVAEQGCKWRGLPKRFGNWQAIYTHIPHLACKDWNDGIPVLKRSLRISELTVHLCRSQSATTHWLFARKPSSQYRS